MVTATNHVVHSMAYLTAYLPLVDGVAIQTAIENHARREGFR